MATNGKLHEQLSMFLYKDRAKRGENHDTLECTAIDASTSFLSNFGNLQFLCGAIESSLRLNRLYHNVA